MTTKPIVIIGGARPNFMKIAPLYRELERRTLAFVLINAGQHKDAALSSDFFTEFGMRPRYSLEPRGATPEELTADMEKKITAVLESIHPPLVVVVGDVNATLAGARAAHALTIPLAHVEAGLRSCNPKMQEERNRIETDRLASLLFATEESGIANLKKEGITRGVHLVGNTMLDTVRWFEPRLHRPHEEPFYFVTLHRAENVDERNIFCGILDALEIISEDSPLYLPLHPRTKKQAEAFGLTSRLSRIFRILPPLPYADALSYEKYATLVLTDSGGIQEETTFLGTPCITLREETERPVTVEKGTNSIGGISEPSILKAYRIYKAKGFPRKQVNIPLWDGHAAGRIVDILSKTG